MSCRESMKFVLFLAFLLTGTFSEPDGSEISSSIEPTQPNEYPFMVRLHIGTNRCAASLIAPRFLATSSICFYAESGRGLPILCRPGLADCYAVIREHNTNKEEDGQRKIEFNNKRMFHQAPYSNLAIIELEDPVELDEKAKIVRVAEEWLSVDDTVLSLGWGMTSEGTFPSVLQKVQLRVSKVQKEGRTYTDFGKNANNTPVNLCAAVGGGPLLAQRNGEWLLYATLDVWRGNCETTNSWSPLAPYMDWIQKFIYKPDLTSVYSQPTGAELKLKKAHLIETLPRLGKEWEISFEFKPENYDQSGFTSILHLSTGEDSSVLGSRIPAIFHHPNIGLHVATAIGNEPNLYLNIHRSPPVGQWSTIVVSQLKPWVRTTMSVNVSDDVPRSMLNPEPREFLDVKVYGSDPWYEAQPGSIRGLTIKTK